MAYIEISDVRAAGLLIADYPDDDVTAAIEMWQSFLDRACRQWFESKAATLLMDGTDSDALHLSVPIIDITSLKLNNSTTALDENLYKVYNGTDYPDDRRNPRIKLVGDEEINIFSSPSGFSRLKFRKGRQNQEISGTFGFVESDGTTPKLIQRALLKLVIEKLTAPLYSATGATGAGGVPALVGAMLEERTDGHMRKFAQAGGVLDKRAPGLSGITNDQEILDIIRLYKAPLGIATPANVSFN